MLYELGLMESVERGILASFEVDVLEIRESEAPGEDAAPEEVRGRRLAALQTALLKHADTTGTRNLMTFHWRTIEAMAFARALPETAAELHETNPAVCPKRVGVEARRGAGRVPLESPAWLRLSAARCPAMTVVNWTPRWLSYRSPGSAW
ncbi:hypothetical protein [Streptomyces tubercidicus]|uniref:hypothetical protein n=1 Tax=Streptomyces tubercidicus TaxID=47759 RepID=UPI003F5B5C0E